MPMLYPPKPSRSQVHEGAASSAEARRAERRRRERLYEIEFFRRDREDEEQESLLGSHRAAPEVLDHPAHTSGAAALPSDARLARAIEAARNGWVVVKLAREPQFW